MRREGLGKNERAAPLAAPPGPFRLDKKRLMLRVHVQPGARQTGWAGRHGEAFRLRISARAVDGQANAACVAFLAAAAGVSRARVILVHGARSREKLFRIEGASPARVQSLLEACSL
jgi:hypothetical protein